MNTQTIVKAQLDEGLKQQAERICAAAGLSLDALIRSMLEKVVVDGYVSLNWFRPNADTLEAVQGARRGELEPYTSIADLFTELDEEDRDDCPLPARPEAGAQRPISEASGD